MSPFVVGHATHPEWSGALGLVAAQIDAQLARLAAGASAAPPTLGLVYFTDAYASSAEALLAALRQRWPGVAFAGTVGIGVAAGGIEYFDEPALVVMLAPLPREQFQVFHGAAGLRATRPPARRAATALVHADPATPDLPELLAELSDRTESGYLFGGVSSARQRHVQIAEGVFQGGLSGVAFGAEVPLISRVTQGCTPLGPLRRVTASDGTVVLQLDGAPALPILLSDMRVSDPHRTREQLRELVPRLRRTLAGLTEPMPEGSQAQPLSASTRRGGSGNFGEEVRVRHLIGIDPGRQAFAVAESVRPGMGLTFCERDAVAARRDLVRMCTEIRDEIETRAEATRLATGAGVPLEAPPAAAPSGMRGALYVSCAGRGGPHFGGPSAEMQIVRHALGDVPLVGFFAAGEIAHRQLYGYTGVLTVFPRLMSAATVADPEARISRRREVVKALAPLLPAHALLWQREDTVPYECDGLTAYRQQPLVVALPESEAQVAALLKACHALQVPVVARGAGTGLSGGALPHAEGVTLSLAKFNRILAIDRAARTATVQCGVRNLAISEAAAPFGLYYAPDPSSQIACTIGGNVAENSGGVHCLKYGLTLHNVLRVRGFTVEGEPVEFGSAALDAAGLDLLSVVIGSEGMLAITTEVTVRLSPKPQLARCIMASFDDVRQAGDAVAAIIAEGIIPAGLEMMDKPMTAAVEDFVHAGYDLNAAAILLCESDGTPEEVAEEIARMLAVLAGAGASRLEVSRDEAQRLTFWSGRKNAFPASGRISPDYMCMDSTIPRKRLADILLAIAQMEQKYGLRCCNVFHAGDGNLHPLILFDANDPDELHRAELFGADILETSVALGGTVTGEHGVGVEKLSSMCVQFSPEERAQMLSVKRAFDASGLLNPGKVIPTLVRCAEYGKMHVKKGLLPFPGLERF